MYNYLQGEITDIFGSYVVLDVNGVGYEMAASNFTLAECKKGQTKKLYAYLQVKEDGVALFGFASKEEKTMFVRLISVSGVGCKVALSILSGMDCNSLAAAIFNGDTKLLTKIKG
ncbi:MAG: Holliday junction branch migration protein RuvA, partial [Corallococcus sp.]|nr:Holliday junction branch migration protein RuvA [Corallococcus sp.]